MDSEQQAYILLSDLGEKKLLYIWAGYISLSNSVTGKVTGTEII